MQINEPDSIKQHSRLGIASTIIGGGLPLLVTALLMIALAFGKIGDESKVKFFKSLSDISGAAFVFVGLVAPVLHLTGFILGVTGAFSKETKGTFSIAGIVLNSLFGLVGAGIILLIFLFFKYACCAFH